MRREGGREGEGSEGGGGREGGRSRRRGVVGEEGGEYRKVVSYEGRNLMDRVLSVNTNLYGNW